MAVSSRELISPCKYCCLLISCHVAECWTAWSWFSVLWLHVLSLCGIWMNCSRETPISRTVCHVNYSLCWVMFKGAVGSINLIEVLLYLSCWLTQALGNKIVYALGSLNRHIFILPVSLKLKVPDSGTIFYSQLFHLLAFQRRRFACLLLHWQHGLWEGLFY